MKDLAEEIERLIKEHGAPAFIIAAKSHVQPDGPMGCGDSSPCAPGYICVNKECKLDIGN